MMAPARRFTLIELLTVISIMTILAAMLLPSLSRARERGRTTACLSQIRQLGTYCQLYRDDNEGYTWPADFSPWAANGDYYDDWHNWLYEEQLINDDRLLLCPSTSRDAGFNPYGGANRITHAYYLMNVIHDDATDAWTGATDYTSGFGWCSRLPRVPDDTSSPKKPLKITRVPNPGAAILFVDSRENIAAGLSTIGIMQFQETDHGPLDTDGDRQVDDLERYVGTQHLNAFTVVFGDTHGEYRRRTRESEWVAWEE